MPPNIQLYITRPLLASALVGGGGSRVEMWEQTGCIVGGVGGRARRPSLYLGGVENSNKGLEASTSLNE